MNCARSLFDLALCLGFKYVYIQKYGLFLISIPANSRGLHQWNNNNYGVKVMCSKMNVVVHSLSAPTGNYGNKLCA